MTAPLTGRKVLAILIAFFGVIISVNLYMASQAIGTFPGLESKTKYIAGRGFNEERSAQMDLNWTTNFTYQDGVLEVAIIDETGQPADTALFYGTIGRATHKRDDVTLEFQQRGGVFTAHVDLMPGQWNLRLKATAIDGTRFQQRLELFVEG